MASDEMSATDEAESTGVKVKGSRAKWATVGGYGLVLLVTLWSMFLGTLRSGQRFRAVDPGAGRSGALPNQPVQGISFHKGVPSENHYTPHNCRRRPGGRFRERPEWALDPTSSIPLYLDTQSILYKDNR